jgi:Right handed beta helix region
MLRPSQIVATCIAGLGLVLTTPASAARTLSVISRAGLIDALERAESGDRIVLAAGNYGAIDIRGKKWASDVIVSSASPSAPARFDTLTVFDTTHLSLKSIEIGRPLRTDEANYAIFANFRNVSFVTFDAVFFRGSMNANPTDDGNGLSIANGKNIVIKNSRFEQLGRGAQISASTDISLSSNTFQNLRTDGLNFANVQRVSIDRNMFRDFFIAAGDHPDAIQFFTAGTTTASTDIVITNNQIFQGRGVGTQGIFLTDQVGSLPYKNVRIENNLLYVFDGYNGIMVANGQRVEVIGNSVLSEQKDNQKFWIRLEKTEGAVVRNNVADSIVDQNNAAMTLTNNVFLDKTPSFASRIRGLSAQANATAASLIVPGIGYQLPR